MPGTQGSRALAWALGATSVLGYAVLVLIAVLQHEPQAAGRSASGLVTIVLFAALGTLLSLRQPGNAIGWLLSAGALVWLVNEASHVLVSSALDTGSAPTTRVALVAVVDEWIWPLGVLFSAGLPLLLFPSGRVRSPRWRWALRAMVCGSALSVLAGAVSTDGLPNPVDAASPIENPLGAGRLSALPGIGVSVGGLLLVLSMAAAVAAIVARARSAADVERQQNRWIAGGAGLAIAGVLVFPVAELLDWPLEVQSVVFAGGFACLPLSFTVAILRYRLYDLDRIISRTVTYTAVTGLLVVTYTALVTAVSRLTPSGSSLSVAASTLAVAALFQPLRRRVQAAVDRRFNRTRYDAVRTVDEFRVRLREEVDLDAVRVELLAVVHQAVQPEAARLWLRDPVPAVAR